MTRVDIPRSQIATVRAGRLVVFSVVLHLMIAVQRLLPSLLLFGITTASAAAPLWDGWRGPDRDAEVLDFDPPQTWPSELEKVWSVDVGSGYSSPLVEGDRIYQQTRVNEEEVLTCLDAGSGDLIWRAKTSVPFTPGGGGRQHGAGPKSTPTLADGKIFTLGITGVLTGWNASDGEKLWQRDFRDRFEKTYPYWGIATSPLVENGRLMPMSAVAKMAERSSASTSKLVRISGCRISMRTAIPHPSS